MRTAYSILAGLPIFLLLLCGCFFPKVKDYYVFVGWRVEDAITKNAIPNAKVYYDRNGYYSGFSSGEFCKEKLAEMRVLTTDSEGICGQVLRLNPTISPSERDTYPSACVVANGYEATYGLYKVAPQCNQSIDFRPYFKAQNMEIQQIVATELRVIQLKRMAK